jgi:hypothetical protein
MRATARSTKIALLCGLVLHTSACEPQNGIGNAVHRDSAGIHITENRDPSDSVRPWIVETEPRTEIGVVEGDPMYQLFQVSDAARLSDGSIVVVNSGTSELRIFDETGRFVRTLGGQGPGPGEFRYIESVVVLPGDSLLTLDMQGRKRAWFGPSGTLARERRLDGSGWPLASGQVFTRFPVRSAQPPLGWYRGQEVFAVLDPESGTVDTLGWFPMEDNILVRDGDRVRHLLPPFFRNTWWAIGTDRVFVGDSDRYEVLVYGLDGTLRQIIRLDRPAEPVTDADRVAYETLRRESVEPGARPAIERLLRALEWHRTKPAFGRLYADTENRLWAKPHVELRFDAPYDVFDTSGVYLGKVTLPDGVEPLEIGTDYVIGLWRDESRVEFVRVYRMSRR